MSKNSGPRPRGSQRKLRFAIVASEFNSQYVNGLVAHARQELAVLAPKASVSVYRVPGSFEIPVVVRQLAHRNNADAIIALGVILKGRTDHAKNLASSVTSALQQIAIDRGVPVINAVLSLKSESQARERCLEDKINRGMEAARAAVAISQSMAKLKRS